RVSVSPPHSIDFFVTLNISFPILTGGHSARPVCERAVCPWLMFSFTLALPAEPGGTGRHPGREGPDPKEERAPKGASGSSAAQAEARDQRLVAAFVIRLEVVEQLA